MPLDFGAPSHLHVVPDPLLRGAAPEAYETLGGYLGAVREQRRLDLDALAETTRIRRAYLEAIEHGDRSALPSRPFAIGYVRAYARALGLDPEIAVARFKAEWPEGDARLRNPIGVAHEETDGRRPFVYAGLGVLFGAVVLWNVAQRTLINDEPPAPTLASVSGSAAPPAPPAGPVRLAGPTPAPAESSLPAPYVTPGLDPAADALAAAKPPPAGALVTPSKGPPVFVTRRPITGATSGPVVLQARDRSVSLVVRRADGEVAYAHVLQPGEAYRVPAEDGLTAEASDPGLLDLYVQGRLAGALAQPMTALAKLTALAPAPAPSPAPAGGPVAAAPAPAAQVAPRTATTPAHSTQP